MKTALVCMTLLATGCESGSMTLFWDDRPVDGIYRMTISRTRNTCSDGDTDFRTTGYMDWFNRLDGLYDVSHGVFDLPLPFSMEGIARPGGNVDHHDSWSSGSTDYKYSLTGIVTPDELDLKVWFKGYRECEQDIRLRGTQWPLADPESLEGFYALRVEPLGNTCDPAAAPGLPKNVVSTIWKTPEDAVWISLFDGLSVNPDPPGGDGRVDWQGTTRVDYGFFPMETPASLIGTYGPEAVELDFAFRDPLQDETADCRYSFHLSGAKRLPSVSMVDNDYRMQYVAENGCATDEDGKNWERNGAARLITQADGTVGLQDGLGAVALTPSGGLLSYTEGSPAEGYVLSYEALSEPPSLSYTLDYQAYDENLAPACSAHIVAEGLVRYVFE